MPTPFSVHPLPGPTFMQRLLRRPPMGDAIASLNNRLAEAASVRDLSESDVTRIAEESRIPLARLLKGALALYRQYLEHCLRDRRLTGDEVGDLEHLKRVLSIPDRDIDAVHDEVARRVYSESVRDAVGDNRLDDVERELLGRLQEDLRLPDHIATELYSEAARPRIQQRVESVIADGRLSPDDEAEINALAASLALDLTYDEETGRALERMRLYWLIENGEAPPAVDPGINLQRSEVCYFTTDIEWYEHRVVTKRMQYAGPTARIRIAKGLYFRAGDIAIRPIREQELRKIDEGRLFLTNKRLIFMGGAKNSQIRLSAILDFNAYSNGVDIQKATDRSPFLQFSNDVDLFVVYLDRALRDVA